MAEEKFSGFFASRFGASLSKAFLRRCAQNDRGGRGAFNEAATLRRQKVTASRDDRCVRSAISIDLFTPTTKKQRTAFHRPLRRQKLRANSYLACFPPFTSS